jgi:hypothetical protein
MSKVEFKHLDDFKGLGKALCIANNELETVVTLDIGPRIMHFSKPGRTNILEDEATLSEILPDGSKWSIYGGHRVWHSPEAFPRSYMTDSHPLEKYELLEDGICMYQKEEPWVHVQKVIELHLFCDSLKIINKLVNKGAWPIEVAVWSLTVGSRKGREVCPVVQRNTGLLPNTLYVSWPYSRLNDERVYWGQKYIVVDNDPDNQTAFKFGYPNEYGWAAYFNHDLCFIKKFTHDRDGRYPDLGCSWETYTSYWGVELESLSPLSTLKAGETAVHVDEWFLFDNVKKPDVNEEEIEAILEPIAKVACIELPAVCSKGWDPNL